MRQQSCWELSKRKVYVLMKREKLIGFSIVVKNVSEAALSTNWRSQLQENYGNMKSEQKQPINISIWGKFPEWEETAPADFLWHDTVEALPELGSVLLILETTFQVEAVCLDGDDVEQQTYLIDVRPLAGSIAPTFVFSCSKT